jgi:hypothetical protein
MVQLTEDENNQIYELATERRDLVNTPASYSGGPGFKPMPADFLSWLLFLCFFQPFQANGGNVDLP